MVSQETHYLDFAQLQASVAQRCVNVLRDAIALRATASAALAGGSTPFPIYGAIAATQNALDFSKLSVLVSDERWVPAEHSANNLSKLKASFAHASGVRFIDLLPSVVRGDQADANAANTALAELRAPLDLVVLGMGADGHFASLFPGSAQLAEGYTTQADALAVVPNPLPIEAPFSRISLSLQRILSAHTIMLLITGDKKREVLEQAKRDRDGQVLPIAELLLAIERIAQRSGSTQQTHLPRFEIHWSPA
jgi:6-phosphogluconolactonase